MAGAAHILNPDFKVAPHRYPGGLQTRSSSKVFRHGGAVSLRLGDDPEHLGNALADFETRAPTERRTGRKPQARDRLLRVRAGGQTVLDWCERTRACAAESTRVLPRLTTLQRSRLDFFAGVLGHAESPFIDRFDVESPVAAYLESRQFLLPQEAVNR